MLGSQTNLSHSGQRALLSGLVPAAAPDEPRRLGWKSFLELARPAGYFLFLSGPVAELWVKRCSFAWHLDPSQTVSDSGTPPV